jgi:hypothetical protein
LRKHAGGRIKTLGEEWKAKAYIKGQNEFLDTLGEEMGRLG